MCVCVFVDKPLCLLGRRKNTDSDGRHMIIHGDEQSTKRKEVGISKVSKHAIRCSVCKTTKDIYRSLR